MDLLLICRDALENSVLTNLILSIEMKKKGAEVGILFTQEALLVIAGKGPFDWSHLLRDRPTRVKVANNAKKLGIQTHEGLSPHYPVVDTGGLLKAAREIGVELLACPMWVELLALQKELPPEIRQIDFNSALTAVEEAKKVIGAF